MIHGNEQIDLNFIQNMELKDFVEKDDFLPMDGEKNSSVVLTDGDFLICYPSDGHRTAVQVQEPEAIKKGNIQSKDLIRKSRGQTMKERFALFWPNEYNEG